MQQLTGLKNVYDVLSNFSDVTFGILDVRQYNVFFARDMLLHVIQSKELVRVFSTMVNTRQNLKETNEFFL